MPWGYEEMLDKVAETVVREPRVPGQGEVSTQKEIGGDEGEVGCWSL